MLPSPTAPLTAISGGPVKNSRFYTRDLGRRFVKKTVNFDDPSTYHFYFGDETGHPGTILTFFPWMNATAGQRGVGQASQTAFGVPLSSIGYWTNRFIEKGISYQKPEKRFGETVLPFTDQDGMALALVGIANAENEPSWSNGDVPSEHAIRGLQGVTLLLDSAQKTAAILTDVFGFREVAREGSTIRFTAAGDAKGSVVDIHEAAGVPRHHQGRGSVHHIAFRAADDAQQAQMTEKLTRDHARHPMSMPDVLDWSPPMATGWPATRGIKNSPAVSPAVTFPSVTTSALATGPASNHRAPANNDIPQPRNARAALLSSKSTLARKRPWISSLAFMRRQLRHITVSSSPQRAAALDSRLAPAGCACLLELPVVQADQLLRRLIGFDGARLDPRLECPLERKRRV